MANFTTRLSTALRMARGTRASASTVSTTILNSPSIELAIDQKGHVLAAEKDQSGIFLKTWDRRSGRLLSVKKLANTESSFVGMFSPGAEYLLTGYVGDGPDATAFVQLWRTTTCTKHGGAFEFTKGGPEDTPLSISPDGVSLLLRRQEAMGRQTDVYAGPTPNGEFRTGGRIRYRLTPVLVDLPTCEETILPAPANQFTGKFSADGRFVLFNSPKKQRRYDLKAGTFDPPLVATENASASPSVRRGSRGRFGPPTSRTAARNSDGTLTATIIADSVVQIRPVGSNDLIGREEPLLVELSHPSPVVKVAFNPEGNLVVTAAADGLIRQWSLPQRWTGTPEEIRNRVERHTGITLAEADRVVAFENAADLNETEQNSDDRQTLQGDGPNVLASSATKFLTRDEDVAIRLRDEGRWEEADAALAMWASLRPDDWQPHALRLRTLVRLRKFDEADAEWKETTSRIGRDAAYAWLKADFDTHLAYSSDTPSTYDARYNRLDEETAAIQGWYSGRLLKSALDDATKAALLLSLAKSHEVKFEFNEAAEAISRAVVLDDDSTDMHHYRAHLMERLNRWDEALESREAEWDQAPDDSVAAYRLMTSHLYSGNAEAAHRVWAKFVEQFAEAVTPDDDGSYDAELASVYTRDRIAKTRLVMGGQMIDEIQSAIAFANSNFDNETAMSGRIACFFTQCKGVADYRTGSDAGYRSAIKHLDTAVELFHEPQTTIFGRGISLCRFYSAMAHYRLGDRDAARRDYLEGLEHQASTHNLNACSSTATWSDWQLAEVARREAAELLKIDLDAIDPPITDTSDWTILFEEDFDEGISENWKRLTGEWSVVDGAVRGVLANTGDVPSYDRLEREFPDLPDTFEIEYETWTSHPMLAACFLRQSIDDSKPLGHRVALSSSPDRELVMQNQASTGVSLLTNPGWAERGFWFPGTNPDFKVQPRQHYKVRIIRQPQRITVVIDGKQVLSERVRNTETRSIRFFARGEEGTKMFVDNLRIRVPAE